MPSHHGLPDKRPNAQSPGPAPSSSGKGKAKMEEFTPEGDGAGETTAADADERTCGICLTEEGRSIRGAIDSCDHYFCFICIMEWAKIESRCPLCKQRFGSIRRLPVRGVLLRERVVKVPVRDQVCQLSDTEPGDIDPYADTTCSVCHCSTDENLLLLCDLCDSATHTYCVGQGFTVPEGDWYCHDCTILKNTQIKMQDDDCYSDENFNKDTATKTMTEDCSPVSIFEIIHDENPSNSFSRSQVKIIGREINERESKYNVSIKEDSKGNVLDYVERSSHLAPTIEASSSSAKAKAKATDLGGARTLRQCRNLHVRIRILRDNWYALRSGSLDFRSSLDFHSGASNCREHNAGGNISSTSTRHPAYHEPSDGNEAFNGSEVFGETNICTSSHDVNKAWKMLEIAKSLQRVPTGAKANQQSPNLPHKRSSECTSAFKSSTCPNSRNFPKDKCVRHDTSEVLQERSKLQSREKRLRKFSQGVMGHCDKGISLSSVLENLKRERELCPRGVQNSQQGIYSASGSGSVSELSAYSEPSYGNQVGTFVPAIRKEAPEDLKCNTFKPSMNSVLDKNMDRSSTRTSESAKTEIQTLVKLNLKLHCRGHHLGTVGFKEVARAATHTILAACGLDHTKSKARPFPSSICRHSDQAKLRRSNLMPDSCRDCFYSFVKDVVESVVAENTSVSGKN